MIGLIFPLCLSSLLFFQLFTLLMLANSGNVKIYVPRRVEDELSTAAQKDAVRTIGLTPSYGVVSSTDKPEDKSESSGYNTTQTKDIVGEKESKPPVDNAQKPEDHTKSVHTPEAKPIPGKPFDTSVSLTFSWWQLKVSEMHFFFVDCIL